MSRRPVVKMRADAGLQTGYGHFVRTCALAGYLAEEFDCRIASFNPAGGYPSEFQARLIAQAGAKPLIIEGESMEAFDRAFADALEPTDLVVLDNYYYSTPYQTEVRRRSRALVCIDDMHDRHFTADAVLTFCPLTRGDFSLEDYTEFHGGVEWSFLRRPFLEPQSNEPRDPRRIVMAMGGADPYRLTDRIAGLILEIDPDYEVDVLAGDTVEVTPGPRVNVHRRVSADRIAELFDRASLGIFPASTVCVEALARQLPIAAGHYADNQEEFYADGVARGWFRPLGDLRDDSARLGPRLREALEASSSAVEMPDFNARRRDIVALFKRLSETTRI